MNLIDFSGRARDLSRGANVIVFLDIDGVMHPIDRRDGIFSCLDRFESAMRDCVCDIVISSSWRTEHTIEDLRTRFSNDIAARIVGITPDHYDGFAAEIYGREKEILAWLREACRDHEPWVAVDDSEWMFSPASEHLVRTDPGRGFDDVAAVTLRLRLAQQQK